MIKKSFRSALVVPALLLLACASGGPKSGPVSTVDDDATGVEDDAGPASEPEDEGEDPEEDAGPDPATQEGICGDDVCNINETCASCSPDCGVCPVCELAPTCTGSAAIPSSALHLEAFDNADRTLYTSGVDDAGVPEGTPFEETNCVAPQLRMRVRQINVVRDGVSLGSANLYCIVSASDGVHSEVMITPLQPNVGDDHPPLIFPPEAAMFWGQGMAWQTLANLTVTYQCFRAVSNESYTKVFDAIQEGAAAAGGVAGPWGWAFGVGSVAAGLISAAIPEGQDESRVNVQQTIDSSMLLELTNGRRWVIRGTGDAPGIGGYWDWSMEVESWGCSDARPTPAQ
jgi:hypothetical protein